MYVYTGAYGKCIDHLYLVCLEFPHPVLQLLHLLSALLCSASLSPGKGQEAVVSPMHHQSVQSYMHLHAQPHSQVTQSGNEATCSQEPQYM